MRLLFVYIDGPLRHRETITTTAFQPLYPVNFEHRMNPSVYILVYTQKNDGGTRDSGHRAQRAGCAMRLTLRSHRTRCQMNILKSLDKDQFL